MQSVMKSFSWLFCLSLACVVISSTDGSLSKQNTKVAEKVPPTLTNKQQEHTPKNVGLEGRSPLSTTTRSSYMASLFAAKIAGGYEAPLSTAIHVAHLSITNSDGTGGSCTGSVLSWNTILTAAHCFVNDDDEFDVAEVVVRVGSQSNRGPKYLAKSVVVFKKYDIPSFRNDVALVTLFTRLEKPFKPIDLPPCSKCFPKDGQEVFAAGFGIIDNDETRTNTLMETKLVVRSFATCRRAYNELVGRVRFGKFRMFCAMDEDFPDSADTAVCEGDSGGPIFLKESGYGHGYGRVPRFVQLGFTSFGSAKCNTAGAVDWFVNLARYKKDILNFLKGRESRWMTIFTSPDA